jgi:hypothetical protein
MAKQPTITELDFQQVIRRVYDDANDRLRTDTNITIDGSGGLDVIISDLNDSVAIGDGSGNLATITTVGASNGLDVNILGGEFSASGLKTGLKTTRMTITDVRQAVPNVPLANRNGMSIRVLGVNVVYFGNNTVTSLSGYPKLQFEEMVIDIKDTVAVELYAVCSAGQTCEIAILEVA